MKDEGRDKRQESPAGWRGRWFARRRKRSGLQLVEHRRLFVESSKDFLKLGVAALDDESHILLPAFFASYLHRTRHIMLLLLGPVEPAQEKPSALSLLAALCAAHVKQNVGILTEKLLDDADNGLCNLLVTWRRLMFKIGKIKPISREIKVAVQFEINGIEDVIIGSEQIFPIWTQPNKILRMSIDKIKIKCIHFLHCKIEIVRLFSSAAFLNNGLKFCFRFFFPSQFALAGRIKPRKNLFASTFPPCYCSFHNAI